VEQKHPKIQNIGQNRGISHRPHEAYIAIKAKFGDKCNCVGRPYTNLHANFGPAVGLERDRTKAQISWAKGRVQ